MIIYAHQYTIYIYIYIYVYVYVYIRLFGLLQTLEEVIL